MKGWDEFFSANSNHSNVRGAQRIMNMTGDDVRPYVPRQFKT